MIELLVVISIIALLVSILLPALGKAREQAKASVCLSNEKQQHLAMMMYTQDYDDFLAPSFYHAALSSSRPDLLNLSVYERLAPYGPSEPGQDVTNPQGLWVCPADQPAKGHPDTYPPTSWRYAYWSESERKYLYVSYGYNMTDDTGTNPTGPYGLYSFGRTGRSRRVSTIRTPSEALMFVDGCHTRTHSYYNASIACGAPVDPFHLADSNAAAVNLVAVDGHARSFRDFVPTQGYYQDYGDWTLPETWYWVGNFPNEW